MEKPLAKITMPDGIYMTVDPAALFRLFRAATENTGSRRLSDQDYGTACFLENFSGDLSHRVAAD